MTAVSDSPFAFAGPIDARGARASYQPSEARMRCIRALSSVRQAETCATLAASPSPSSSAERLRTGCEDWARLFVRFGQTVDLDGIGDLDDLLVAFGLGELDRLDLELVQRGKRRGQFGIADRRVADLLDRIAIGRVGIAERGSPDPLPDRHRPARWRCGVRIPRSIPGASRAGRSTDRGRGTRAVEFLVGDDRFNHGQGQRIGGRCRNGHVRLSRQTVGSVLCAIRNRAESEKATTGDVAQCDFAAQIARREVEQQKCRFTIIESDPIVPRRYGRITA